jgi:tetratricopeptide (TPR) repeat protein
LRASSAPVPSPAPQRTAESRAISELLRQLPPARPPESQPPPDEEGLPLIEVEAVDLSPDEHFRRGEWLLRRKDFDAAKGAFRRAAKGESDNGTYLAYQGWTEYLCDPESKLAESTLRNALKLSDGRAMASFFLGSIALNSGDLKEAEKQLKTAAREAPKNQDVIRAQRLVKMRLEQAKSKSGGLLGRLLGRE